MKLFFKLSFILFSKSLFASQIIIYYPSVNYKEHASEIRNIFVKTYKVPINLMKIVEKKKCESNDKRFLELCILENYELIKVDNKNQEEIKESLLIFSKTTEVSYDY